MTTDLVPVGAAISRQATPRPAIVRAWLVPVPARVTGVTPCTCGRRCTGDIPELHCYDSQIYNRRHMALWARHEALKWTGDHPQSIRDRDRLNADADHYDAQADLAEQHAARQGGYR